MGPEERLKPSIRQTDMGKGLDVTSILLSWTKCICMKFPHASESIGALVERSSWSHCKLYDRVAWLVGLAWSDEECSNVWCLPCSFHLRMGQASTKCSGAAQYMYMKVLRHCQVHTPFVPPASNIHSSGVCSSGLQDWYSDLPVYSEPHTEKDTCHQEVKCTISLPQCPLFSVALSHREGCTPHFHSWHSAVVPVPFPPYQLASRKTVPALQH